MVVKVTELVAESARVAEHFVTPFGRRWAHVRSVARAAETLSATVDEADGPILVAAAWLNDIGYAPELATTQFHLNKRRVRVATFYEVGGKQLEGLPKTGKRRTVSISASLVDELRPLVERRGKDALVFTTKRGLSLRANNWRLRE